jgi:hypothetical protein
MERPIISAARVAKRSLSRIPINTSKKEVKRRKDLEIWEAAARKVKSRRAVPLIR